MFDRQTWKQINRTVYCLGLHETNYIICTNIPLKELALYSHFLSDFILIWKNSLIFLEVSKRSLTFALRKQLQGEILEWLKRHAWKACIPLKGIAGSNPALSAVNIDDQ